MRTPFILALSLLVFGCRGTPDDLDEDGYDINSDCNDGDASVHPGADELCNGVDDDCSGDVDEDALDATIYYLDGDGDGSGTDVEAMGCDAPAGYVAETGDCDDSDGAIYPGAPEADCADPVDYNCDGSVGYADADADGFPACEDCDDTAAGINPSAVEVCDAADNDCDGETDEEGALGGSDWYVDSDLDGYGNPADATSSCDQPEGYVADDSDCDDASETVHPGADELCNTTDDDCDGDVDENATDAPTWYADSDGDGHGGVSFTEDACEAPDGHVSSSDDCDDLNATVNPSATEICDGLDSDCDGSLPDDEADADDDGVGECDGDCDDASADASPLAPERCDGVDNDCDGSIDEADAIDPAVWYIDVDGDGFGGAVTTSACDAPAGWVDNSDDCADLDPTANPAGFEVCNGADNDCDGTVDNNDAWGTDAACPAIDCVDLRDNVPGSDVDGVYWVDPDGAGSFEVYCDQTTDGGGWMIIWKNHGGAIGGEASNAALFANPGDNLITPSTVDLISAKHDEAFARTWDVGYREWVKMTTLWDSTDSVEDENTIRIDMGAVTMREVFNQPINACNPASDTMEVFVGDVSIGSTAMLNHYGATTYGLANNGHGPADDCGLPDDELINDGDPIYRLEGTSSGLNSIRHLFSYVHTSAGRDASRCAYGCWDATSFGGHYDAFTWGVRCDPTTDDVWGDDQDANCDRVDGTDEDGDGYAGSDSGGPDCDDTDADVYPGAGCDLFASCADVLADDGGATDGPYLIDPDGSGGVDPFTAYCDMTNGGWTLVMKTLGGDNTFQYSSTHWTDGSSLLNPTSLNETAANSKLRAFNHVPFAEIRGCAVGAVNGAVNCLEHDFGASVQDSAVDLFSGPEILVFGANPGSDPTGATAYRDEFYTVFEPTGMRDCLPKDLGFNIVANDGNFARWGFANNIPSQGCQVASGNDADGVIGWGLDGQDAGETGAGFTNYFVNNTANGGRNYSADSWLWVR